MQRTSFSGMACSIARALDVIGEPWSPLVLRDVWVGLNRFEQIQADLGISRKVLTARLVHLVEQGVLERHPYDQRPRYEYRLTQKGAELVDLLMVMTRWGDRWLAGEAGPPVLHRHHACGEISSADLRCDRCGEPMHAGDVDPLPGPGAPVRPARQTPRTAPADGPLRQGAADGRTVTSPRGGRTEGAVHA